ncbi:MAG: hypothetical protein ACQGVK_04170 [Myxococcota bacterium]
MIRATTIAAVVLLAASQAHSAEILAYSIKMYSACEPASHYRNAGTSGTIEIGSDYVSFSTAAGMSTVPVIRLPTWLCNRNEDCDARDAEIKHKARIVGMTTAPVQIDDVIWIGDDVMANVALNIKLRLNEENGDIKKGSGTIQFDLPDYLGRPCRSYGTIRITSD